MNSIKLAGAQQVEQADDVASLPLRPQARDSGIRMLDECELLLAAGGDLTPDWPK